MSGHFPPLTCAQFKNVLTKMGFVFREQKGSHEQWVGHMGGQFRKVTVDCPKASFSQELIRSMAKQAGVNKKTIYDFHWRWRHNTACLPFQARGSSGAKGSLKRSRLPNGSATSMTQASQGAFSRPGLA